MVKRSIFRHDIFDLKLDAENEGDAKQAELCTRALEGDKAAWAECERVIWEAEAQVAVQS